MKRILILIVILFIITGCTLGKHTVVFNSAGGSLIDSQTIENGKKVTKPVSPTRSGYSFVGWESDGVSYNFDDEVTNDIELKAVWKSDGTKKVHTVTFDIDGEKSTKNIDDGALVDEPIAPIKKGYKFSGWYLDDSDDIYDFDTIITRDVTIKAKLISDDDISTGSQKTTIYITNMNVTFDKSTLKVGDKMQLNVEIVPTNATKKELEFVTSDKRIATVSATGEISAKKAGNVQITIKTTDGSLINKKIDLVVEN